jgi:hypothetical protein
MCATSTPAYEKRRRHTSYHSLLQRPSTAAAKETNAIHMAIYSGRYAAMAKQPFGVEFATLGHSRALHRESGDIASFTGAIISPLFPKAATMLTAATCAEPVSRTAGTTLFFPAGLGPATPNVLILSLRTYFHHLLDSAGLINHEAVVSLTETTSFPFTSPYPGTITQAAVSHTGTPSFFCPPPPPEPEPYTTGQTQ